ncbi:hypothetical protein A6M21_12695 [Desulfotomaculum copahuensis]|uniref:Carbohydrate kinase PfkB domain-containing protein n=2 Tax=Desulfotomaculum copahuensis TaxID=1838280 RepID=A0A1B7LCW9_9FIRM|nr:hypothetical protein A6M21_12695 [Desulfotomaculum copahuensis]
MEKYGAAAYTTYALAKLLEGSQDQVLCLSHLSPADLETTSSLLAHPNIDLSGLTAVPEGTARIELTYVNQFERRGRQLNIMPPLTAAEMALLAECRAVLLMPLNETDIPLRGVQSLRSSSQATIFLDVHGLVTGVDDSGRRFNKIWSNAQEWIKCINVLKMNEKEAAWVAARPLHGQQEFVFFAAGLIKNGLDVCWITFGDQSSIVSWRREGRIYWTFVPTITGLGPVVDTTGCGDAASAGFVYSYVKHGRYPLIAVILGNTLGSLKATFREVNAFPSHPEINGIIYHHYRDYLHALLDDFLSRKQLIVHEFKGGCDSESFVRQSDGHGHGTGTNHARSGGGKRTSTPGT